MEKPRYSVKFSAHDDSLLIDCVREFEILWKMNHPDFKNNFKKDQIWSSVGKKINKKGDSCKRRWKSIRDHFMREKKDVPGKRVKRKKRASYWKNLNFLRYTPDEQQEHNNVDAEDNEQDCTADDTNIISEDNIKRIIYEDDELPVHECTTTADTADTADDEHFDGDSVDVQATNSRTSTPCSRKKTFTYRSNREDRRNEKIIALLRKKLVDKDELMDCLENVVFEEQKSDENENDLFFKYVAAVVNKFPARMQAIARKRVFAVVSDLELSQFSSPTSTASNEIWTNSAVHNSTYEQANQSG